MPTPFVKHAGATLAILHSLFLATFLQPGQQPRGFDCCHVGILHIINTETEEVQFFRYDLLRLGKFAIR